MMYDNPLCRNRRARAHSDTLIVLERDGSREKVCSWCFLDWMKRERDERERTEAALFEPK